MSTETTSPAPAVAGHATRQSDLSNAGTAAASVALTATLGLAAASWGVALWAMDRMGKEAATGLGPFGFFVALWASMMAAMMLPGAAPAVWRHVRARGRMRA